MIQQPALRGPAQFRQNGISRATGGFSFRSRGAQAANPVAGEAAKDGAQEDATNIAENVRHVGAKVFYRRGKQWVDAAVSEEQQRNPVKIERYSRDYFDLIDYRHTPAI